MAESNNHEMKMDWQLNHSLSECTTCLYSNDHMSDITFILTSKHPAVRLPAHRFLLATRSPVFEAMFYGLLKEQKQEVTLTDVPVDGFSTLLKFVYTDVADVDVYNAMECMQVGHMYRVPGFVQKCETVLIRNINTGNVLCIFETSIIFDLRKLSSRCMDYIKRKALAVFKTEAFKTLSKEALVMIIGESELQAPELAVYKAVTRWCKYRCLCARVPASHGNKRKFLGDAFAFLRLGEIPLSDFANVVAEDNLLSSNEIVMVFRLHHDKSVSKLDFVANDKRIGPVVRFVPVRQRKTHFTKTSFLWNYGVHLVGITLIEQLQQRMIMPMLGQLFFVLLFELNPAKASTWNIAPSLRLVKIAPLFALPLIYMAYGTI